MLTWSQAFLSKTNWAAVLMIAIPAIWNLLISDPTIHIPPNVVHWLALVGTCFVILFRTMNTQGRSNGNSGGPPAAGQGAGEGSADFGD